MFDLKYGPYSPSRLDTGICGHSFYHQYVSPTEETKRKEGLAQARGSAVHEVFEQITERLKLGEQSFSPQWVRNLVVEAVNRHPAAYEELESILEMARLYIDRPPRNLVSDAGVELRLAVRLEEGTDELMPDLGFTFVECDYDDPKAFARGRADIFMVSDDTTEATIYDHKTQPNVEEADTFQMGFYAWVIFKTHPFLNTIKTTLHFARYGFYSNPYVWRREDLFKIQDEILARVQSIETRADWVATPNSKCQYCPILYKCPSMKEFIEIDGDSVHVKSEGLVILGDHNKAVRVAGLVNILEDVLKAAKANLKDYCKAYEANVAIHGKVYQFRASEPKVDWDKVNKVPKRGPDPGYREKIYEIFEKHGIDPKRFMGFSSTFSNSIWLLENEALVKELGSILPKTIDTTFSGYKV